MIVFRVGVAQIYSIAQGGAKMKKGFGLTSQNRLLLGFFVLACLLLYGSIARAESWWPFGPGSEEQEVAEPTREPTRDPMVIAWATAQAEQTEVISTLVAQVAQLEKPVVREVEAEEATTSDRRILVNGVELGLLDPQLAESHAGGFYLPTGIAGKNTWVVEWPEDGTLIVGGVTVNGVDGGVYKVYDTGPATIAVENGFALVTLDKWARDEFCFRVDQAISLGWAHQHVEPLDGWEACSIAVAE